MIELIASTLIALSPVTPADTRSVQLAISGGMGGVGRGFAGFEADFFFPVAPHLDVSFSFRAPAYPLGFSPGMRLRYRLLRVGALSLNGHTAAFLHTLFTVGGPFWENGYGVGLGGSLEQGASLAGEVGSAVLYGGVSVISGMSSPWPVVTVAFDLKVGAAWRWLYVEFHAAPTLGLARNAAVLGYTLNGVVGFQFAR